MFEFLVNLDKELLLFFNRLNNPSLDTFFFWISDKWIWIPFYAYLLWLVYKQEKIYTIVALLIIALTIVVTDQLSSSVIKQMVMRLRPCHDPSISAQVHIVNGYCGGKYGFISSHASNVFALATFLISLLSTADRKLKFILWTWAIIVSFSRIYLGAHFPGDVIAGALLGIVTGCLFCRLFFVTKKELVKIKSQ